MDKQGSIAIKMKGIKASGDIINILPPIEHGGNKLKLYIDLDGKLKFFIETNEVKHTLEVDNLGAYFSPERWHIVLLQWSKDFIAVQIDGQVLAEFKKTP